MNFFFIRHPGHGGGGWLMICINNHPAGMSCVAECNHHTCFNFKARDLTMAHYDAEVHRFFDDRKFYGDVAVGIIKSFHPPNIQYAKKLGDVREVQLVYNPARRFCEKWTRKIVAATSWFRDVYKRDMNDSREHQCEATAAYFAENYFGMYLKTGQPIIRLEDLNKSLKLETGFFARFMEWLTGAEWSKEYVDHIRENWTPAYQYRNWLEWEDPPFGGRICKVVTLQRDTISWNRDNWDEDPWVVKIWHNLKPWQQELYLKYTADIQRELGYNQDGIRTEDDWKYRGAYPWGDVYD